MSDGVFNLIDRRKLLSGEADYGAGQVSAPPGVEANPVGVVLDARIGRHRVRFLGVVPTGETPRFLTIWTPPNQSVLSQRSLKNTGASGEILSRQSRSNSASRSRSLIAWTVRHG